MVSQGWRAPSYTGDLSATAQNFPVVRYWPLCSGYRQGSWRSRPRVGLQGLSPHTLLARNSLTPLLRGLGAPGECGRDGAGWMWSVSTWKTDTCHCSQGVLCEVTACLYPQLLPGGSKGQWSMFQKLLWGRVGTSRKLCVLASSVCLCVCMFVCACVCTHMHGLDTHPQAEAWLMSPWPSPGH